MVNKDVINEVLILAVLNKMSNNHKRKAVMKSLKEKTGKA